LAAPTALGLGGKWAEIRHLLQIKVVYLKLAEEMSKPTVALKFPQGDNAALPWQACKGRKERVARRFLPCSSFLIIQKSKKNEHI
jgi:hypothetical protein